MKSLDNQIQAWLKTSQRHQDALDIATFTHRRNIRRVKAARESLEEAKAESGRKCDELRRELDLSVREMAAVLASNATLATEMVRLDKNGGGEQVEVLENKNRALVAQLLASEHERARLMNEIETTFDTGVHVAQKIERVFALRQNASKLDYRLDGLHVVLDCAHGAAYEVAPKVFHELGATVSAIGVSPDGFNINDKFGATATDNLVAEVKRRKADLGIALDGDADRLVMVDAAGTTYDGDQLLFAIVKHRAAKGAVAGVAGTLMTNLALEQALAGMDVPFARARVGDRYVIELMREKNWLLGGENSGHILCLDKHTTGDGIISALQVLTAMRESGKTLGELTADLRMYPQVLLNVKVPKGFDWKKHQPIADAQSRAERSLNGRGRVLLRPSGTEPVLRVMVEGEPREAIESAAKSIADAVRKIAA